MNLKQKTIKEEDFMYHTSILQFHTANCKNCYKCVRNCPVKAIRVKNQQAQIIEEQCVLCEKCTSVCPQHAKVEHNDIPDIQKEIADCFVQVLECAGVYKRTEKGFAAFKRFLSVL